MTGEGMSISSLIRVDGDDDPQRQRVELLTAVRWQPHIIRPDEHP